MKKNTVLLIVLMALFIGGCTMSKEKVVQPSKGDGTMNFVMKNLDEKKIQLSDFKGKKVYIKFWASWCPVCLNGLKDFEELAQEENDFVVLSVITPDERGEMDAKDFKEWFSGLENNNFEVLLDENSDFTNQVGIRAYPTSGFINQEGKLVRVNPGHVTKEKVKEAMQSIE